ncbi:dystrotelin isoform X2 [Numida meleagris]|uniref:dystrotelin isoform X2 n=1 Tax=Numida meleagris TaxID=8996 RepID=UPI000B3DE5EA|nr:dystrotelin isoform X2 [Numida meleagris]
MSNAIGQLKMNPYWQEAFNDIQSSVYRTALKLRSLQSLCQLDLIDVYLIQHVLSSERRQREKQISLKVQQLSGMLKELFERARLEKPGQVDPRAAKFTLSLLEAMYDRSGTGYIKTRSAAAALIALSGDTPLAKYRAFFEFYAVPDGKKALITRNALRCLRTDLNQIPAIVGESCTLSCVEIATHSCFHGVLNSGIVEEKFLSWLRSGPALLQWLPTCYRLSATEMVSHHVRCRVCKNFPITGLRYRCLKCLNFDLCQVCFFTGRLSRSHKSSHPVVEHCVQMSAKANAKHFLCTVRNNLFQDCCRRKKAQRRKALEIMEEKQFPTHKKIPPPAELSASPFPRCENLPLPVNKPVLESPKFISENRTVMHKSENNSKKPEQGKTKIQVIASFEADVLKMHDSIKSIHNKSRYMKKQFNKWKNKMQFLHNCQEDKSFKIEAKLQSLRASHENLEMELRKMKQEVETMLQSTAHASFSLCQNTMPRDQRVLQERRTQGGLNPVQIKLISRTSTDWKALNHLNSANRIEVLESPEAPATVDFVFSEDPVKSVTLQSDRVFMGRFKKIKDNQTYLPELMENYHSGIIRNTALTPAAMQILPDKKEFCDEVELRQLVMKLTDALSLQAQPDQQSALKKHFFSTAEHVCRCFSDLINQMRSPEHQRCDSATTTQPAPCASAKRTCRERCSPAPRQLWCIARSPEQHWEKYQKECSRSWVLLKASILESSTT